MVIVKAPTKHGLDRKFKPWRRGKSEKSNKRSSLKQQLRGIERLLQKLPEGDKERRDELENKVTTLKQEIDEKQKVIQEKKHADKAHGQRFLDRQRLTRQEKQARKQNSTTELASQLFKISLDQIYVAHHPNDVKYMPLFRKGQRVVDASRQLFRRAVTRRRILKSLTKDKRNCPWISKDQYDRLPSVEWTIQDEERVFGGSVTRQGKKEIKNSLQVANQDSRFELAGQHAAVLTVADQVDAELDEKDNDSGSKPSEHDVSKQESRKAEQTPINNVEKSAKKDSENEYSSDSNDSDDDQSEDAVDPLKRLERNAVIVENRKQIETTKEKLHSSEDSDSRDDSSSDEDDVKKDEGQDKDAGDSSSDDDSDSSSDISDDGQAKSEGDPERMVPKAKEEENEDADAEFDDFLMDANNEDDVNVFSMTLNRVPAVQPRGDKSKGWETQQQRPGQFKKRRVRR